MKTLQKKTEQHFRRQARIRAKVFGTAEKPRLAIFRSNRYISAQLIDDNAGRTLATASSKGLKGGSAEKAAKVGASIAESASGKKIAKAVFDRGGFRYAGAVKALADGAREGGLKF